MCLGQLCKSENISKNIITLIMNEHFVCVYSISLFVGSLKDIDRKDKVSNLYERARAPQGTATK